MSITLSSNVESARKTERVKVGNHLFRVNRRYYIRVAVPRDLRAAYRAEGRSQWEVFEPLDTTNRRQAERRCRRRYQEIEAEFAARRQAVATPALAALPAPAEAARPPLLGKDLDRIAVALYRDMLGAYERFCQDVGSRSPAEAVAALDEGLEPWLAGLRDGAWTPRTDEAVDGILSRYALKAERETDAFREARQKIARVITAANRMAATRLMDRGAAGPAPARQAGDAGPNPPPAVRARFRAK